jgi:hypothetical protein
MARAVPGKLWWPVGGKTGFAERGWVATLLAKHALSFAAARRDG